MVQNPGVKSSKPLGYLPNAKGCTRKGTVYHFKFAYQNYIYISNRDQREILAFFFKINEYAVQSD